MTAAKWSGVERIPLPTEFSICLPDPPFALRAFLGKGLMGALASATRHSTQLDGDFQSGGG